MADFWVNLSADWHPLAPIPKFEYPSSEQIQNPKYQNEPTSPSSIKGFIQFSSSLLDGFVHIFSPLDGRGLR
jgi:hypothetical protein